MAKLASTEELLKLTLKQVEAMSRNDLAKVVTKLNDVATHRMKSFEKANISSPAVDYIKRTGGFEGVRGKNKEEVAELYQRAKGFLTSKTGTVPKAKIYHKEQFEKVARASGMSSAELESQLSETQKKRFWKVLDRAAENGTIQKSGDLFYRARKILAQEIEGGDKRRGVDKLYEKIFGEGGTFDKAYKEYMDQEEAEAARQKQSDLFYAALKNWNG